MPSLTPLVTNRINKSFGGRAVLTDISLEVKPNAIFGIVGLNGVGKTTLMKIILNLIFADSGDIKLFNHDHRNPLSRQHLSFLPEKFIPPTALTGHEFLAFSCAQYQVHYKPEEAETLCDKLGFDTKYLMSYIRTYSKGMGQKLGLVAQLLRKPKLLILDEPMSGLDPKARIEVKEILNGFKKTGSVLFSSHILADIEEISDKMSLLDKGRLVFTGTPAQFKTCYNAPNLEGAFLNATKGKAC